ncbi:MAG: ABC transporter permease [Armatimonadota bacterium]|nr:ABC transporter permease [Armatimonadota bacterium]MDR7401458.1 ABC transporter permease [Armatimonadota bacterium]MDR7404805.1 ABC transporter permease [Armatimonadota bacterium]MDR7437206.1 ABC transporter permease [Armatimonadota bacterium]MDR7473006.1 ABC transporter permease [Armatimonadota bacterium]
MAQAVVPAVPRTRAAGTLARVATYAGTRLLALFLTVVAGVYLTILVANMGGYVDRIKRAEIREQVSLQVLLDPQMRMRPPEERQRLVEQLVRLEEQRLGLDRPFLVRSVTFLREALLLRLGFAEHTTSDTGSRLVRNIILDRLPPTLLLFVTAQVLLFVTSVVAALSLSRRYGSRADRLIIALAPTSAAPAWFYGIFLILIFAALLRVLPFGGMVDAPPPEHPVRYALSVLKHMILPTAALWASTIFLAVYSWRTFFLIFSSEDYVEMAQAKGLPPAMIERRYILRPTLPTIITSFALGLIGAWTGAIVLETVFTWPGLGRALYQAIGAFDTPVIVGVTIIYAYLLALTVFVLDIVYAVVDPRVKVGGEERR